MFDRIIILGSGCSVQEGIDKGLWDKLKSEVTFGLNYMYMYYNSTALICCDSSFYENNKPGLKELPMILARKSPDIVPLENTLILNWKQQYLKDQSWKKNLYYGTLSGVFAISAAILLGVKEIYLLGYDYTGVNGKTHFYENDSKWLDKVKNTKVRSGDRPLDRGVGVHPNGRYKTSFYNNPAERFEPFLNYKDVKIYNVGLQSKISYFEKIGYDNFFSKLNSEVNQEDARSKMKAVIK